MAESKKPAKGKSSAKPSVAGVAGGGSGVRAKTKRERTDASEHAATLRRATEASPRTQATKTAATEASPRTKPKPAAKAAAKPAAKRAVARPLTRTITPRPARAERGEKPAAPQPKRVREVRPLPDVPAGHAALIGQAGASGETIALPEALTTTDRGVGVLFQAFNAARANARQGTASTKTRAQVRGGGAKPWRQKGTGRARAGSIRSPIWRHGGVVFGPNGRTYWQRLPEKMRKSAFAEAFADQAARGRVLVFDALPNGRTPDAWIKTSAMREWLDGIGDIGRTIVVADDLTDMAGRAFANLARVEVRSTGTLRLTDLLRGETILVSRGTLDTLAARAGARAATSDGERS